MESKLKWPKEIQFVVISKHPTKKRKYHSWVFAIVNYENGCYLKLVTLFDAQAVQSNCPK